MSPRSIRNSLAIVLRVATLFVLTVLFLMHDANGGSPVLANTSDNGVLRQKIEKQIGGKSLILRNFYSEDSLRYDATGAILGAPAIGPVTLASMEIRKVRVDESEIDIEGPRVGLKYNDDAGSFDRVPLPEQPVHITIERDPEGDKDSYDSALFRIFARSIDPPLIGTMPDYWRGYFRPQERSQRLKEEVKPTPTGTPQLVQPQVLHKHVPSSTDLARHHKVTGTATVELVVEPSGKTSHIAIARPIGFGLDERAIEAARLYRFQPASLQGAPVPVEYRLNLSFKN